MIKKRNVAKLKDSNKQHDVSIEVNKKGVPSDVVVLHFDKEVAYINKKDLYDVVFMIADPDTQVEMLPTAVTTVTTYERSIKIKATKDIKKGETITANVSYSIPTTIYEGLRGVLTNKRIKEFRKAKKD
jgi:hypothetical protein